VLARLSDDGYYAYVNCYILPPISPVTTYNMHISTCSLREILVSEQPVLYPTYSSSRVTKVLFRKNPYLAFVNVQPVELWDFSVGEIRVGKPDFTNRDNKRIARVISRLSATSPQRKQ